MLLGQFPPAEGREPKAEPGSFSNCLLFPHQCAVRVGLHYVAFCLHIDPNELNNRVKRQRNSGRDGWWQIFFYAWCVSRVLAGALRKIQHTFLCIQHPLWETPFPQTALWVMFNAWGVQRKIQQLFDGTEGTKVCVDDILIWENQSRN